MLIREFISETNKNKMISDLLKYYKVGSVKVKQRSMKDHAHFNVDTGTLELSTRYKTIKSRQIKEFLITILHEIYHAMDAKKYGWKKFKEMYEYEMAVQIANDKDQYKDISVREIKDGVNSGLQKVNKRLEEVAIDVKGDMLKDVSAISCNNDAELGKIIAEAYEKVGKNGVVLMEEGETNETYVDLVEGVQIECGLTSPNFVTNKEKHKCELENPLVLIVSSEIPNIRKIQNILEHVIKSGRALLIVAQVAQQVKAALMMNKVKGNIKVNIIDLPGFGPTRKDATEDLAILTGATVIDEELGDDLDMITIDHLGEAEYSSTDDRHTVITLEEVNEELAWAGIKLLSKDVNKNLTELMKILNKSSNFSCSSNTFLFINASHQHIHVHT